MGQVPDITEQQKSMDKVFQTVEWARTTNIYEVNVRQYTAEGTFAAFAKELPRLRDMGIETIWFMPVTPISVQNRKGPLGSYYACSDYVTVNPEFGTLEDLKAAVKKAHDLGLKVIIDWVANHTGWDHSWTRSHPDFYYRNEQGGFQPPFPEWEDTIHLDYRNRELRKAMIDAMKFWLKECDLDGFRCDMAHLVPLDFWKEARVELDAIKPLFWLAETEDVSYHEAFDASYAWEFLHTMERFWKKQIDIQGIDRVLHKYADVFPSTAIRAFFTSNHDENSHSGSEYERMGESARVFAVLCATWGGVPLIYSGQEMPLVNKRLHFFEKDPIPWTGKYELHDFYKKLLGMRARNPAFRAGDADVRTFRLETTNNSHVFAYLKKYKDHEAVIILNLSNVDDLQFDINGGIVGGIYNDIFSGEKVNMDEQRRFRVGKWGWVVLER